MYNIYLKLPTSDKTYLYNKDCTAEDLDKMKSDKQVLVNTGQVIEVADVLSIKKIHKANPQKLKGKEELGKGEIIGLLSNQDKEKVVKDKEKALSYIPLCEKKIAHHQLNMKLFDADLSFDEKKLTLYFGAQGRVDFRDLVLEFIKSFKKIIRLQQIGARDQAKICGGFGPCGRELCCQKFLKNMESVTLESAKLQDLSSGVGKISGVCGKLMCCLDYELKEYIRVKQKLPRIGTKLKTRCGKAVVVEHNIFKESLVVRIEQDGRKLEVKV